MTDPKPLGFKYQFAAGAIAGVSEVSSPSFNDMDCANATPHAVKLHD